VTGERLDRSGLDIEFDESFDGPALDPVRWIPAYLPHWSTPELTAARYELRDGRLHLRIDADQRPWCPDFDGDLRVSSIQTAEFAGPLGSSVGGHRFHPDAVVRTAQVNRILYTPHHGLIELRSRALDDPRLMVALWMIGVGDEPGHTGEICVMEIFGQDVAPDRARVGMGVHPFGDGALVDDFDQVELELDAREFHTYGALWEADQVAWYVDDRLVRTVRQSPAYPLQLMLDIYEFPPDGDAPDHRRPEDYPKVFEVDWVRGWRLVR
jgi:hypothetical protein